MFASKNMDVDAMNKKVLDRLNVSNVEEERHFKSIDEIADDGTDQHMHYPIEYLNSLNPPGVPPHDLHLKEGAIVMLLRNLAVHNGLCNGTRLRVESMGAFVLCCRFIAGERNGHIVIIPRIDNHCDSRLPFRLMRRQYPVRLAFAMTINKSQGQTSSKVGLHRPTELFSPGKLSVVLSGVRSCDDMKIRTNGPAVANIVYTEVLS